MSLRLSLSTFLLLLPSLTSAAFTVNACFQVAGQGVSDALVKCYDADWGQDDRVGADTQTDANGCVAVYDNQWWFEHPDVYCKIYANGECFATKTTTTLDNHFSNTDADFGTIALDYDPDYCGDFGLDGNGCGPASFPSWLNDAATAVSGFSTQCGAHDVCYGQCDKPRSLCDSDFYDDMEQSCATGNLACNVLARLYFEAVVEFGESSCVSTRNQCSSTALCSS